MSVCGWCRGAIAATRRDAKWCSKRCRQAAHRASIGRADLEAATRPARLAYADPPYVGLSRKYYGGESSFAGEVDHGELLDRLATYDGWALSCSSASVAQLGELITARHLEARLGVWIRHPAPHPSAPVVTGWEGLWFSPARSRRVPSRPAMSDVFDAHPGARPRDTLPGAVTGMKPPAYAVWVFELLGATIGDELDDLYPGSGIVARTWDQWTGAPPYAPAWSTLFPPASVRRADPDDR